MQKKVLLSSVIFAIAMPAMSGFGVAQQVAEPSPRQVAPPPQNVLNAPPPNISELLRRNNGSMFRAAVSMPDDPRLIRATDVSPFAVPPSRPRTLQKHDLVTIIVREQSSFSSEGTTDTKKDTGIDAKLEQFPSINLSDFVFKNGIGTVTPQLKLSGQRDYKGEGSVDRKDNFTARIQAEVVDVKPNGTLVVQARKRITTDEEEQVFMLNGVCRVQDIQPDNTVLSTQLFDLELRKTHSGAVHDATKRGWIPRAIDWLNPF